jgi:hypothetical protein
MDVAFYGQTLPYDITAQGLLEAYKLLRFQKHVLSWQTSTNTCKAKANANHILVFSNMP